jgi:DNA-binding transcriptional ArsR family regulator
MTAMPSGGGAEILSATFGALSDPIRRHILMRLAHGSCSVSELGSPFPVSAPAISKHLNVLEQAGMIIRWKQGRTYYCRLQPEPLQRAGQWIEDQRGFWEQQLDQLQDYLRKEERTWTTRQPRNPASPSDSGADSQHRPKGSSKPGHGRKL